MWQLLQIELYKIFHRPRTYIAFGAIAALIILLQFGFKVDGQEYADFMLQSLGNFEIEGKLLNGYMVGYIILQLLLVHVPLLVTLIAADVISGEANSGTLRLQFSKPYSRTSVIMAKFLATSVYTLLLLIWVAILALFVSIFIFGTGDLFLMRSDYIVLIKQNDVFWRYCCAFGFAYIALLTVAALGFFFSAFAENSIGPIITTMSIIILFTVLGTLNLPVFETINPYLFTTRMVIWKEFFDEKVTSNNEAIAGSINDLTTIINALIVLAVYIVALLSATVFIMKRKDILS
ncbi:ABC transporter permease [Parafilimonas sp.]|uniref:ABC transporter permease n=1 Tax=Parafilimonas sp. TaxID=1969739 RepID=UPI003F7F79AE